VTLYNKVIKLSNQPITLQLSSHPYPYSNSYKCNWHYGWIHRLRDRCLCNYSQNVLVTEIREVIWNQGQFFNNQKLVWQDSVKNLSKWPFWCQNYHTPFWHDENSVLRCTVDCVSRLHPKKVLRSTTLINDSLRRVPDWHTQYNKIYKTISEHTRCTMFIHWAMLSHWCKRKSNILE